MAKEERAPDVVVIVADADVLIHFMNVGRFDLLQVFPSTVIVTEHVRHEVTRRSAEDTGLFEQGLKDGAFRETVVDGAGELALFARLANDGRLGDGECSAISAAICRGHDLAMNDKTATKLALRESGGLLILRTQDIIVSLIHDGALGLEDADALLEEWATHHRFQIRIKSFAELL